MGQFERTLVLLMILLHYIILKGYNSIYRADNIAAVVEIFVGKNWKMSLYDNSKLKLIMF